MDTNPTMIPRVINAPFNREKCIGKNNPAHIKKIEHTRIIIGKILKNFPIFFFFMFSIFADKSV